MMKQWSRSEAETVIKGGKTAKLYFDKGCYVNSCGKAAKLYFDKGCYVNSSYALVIKNFTRNTCVEIQVQ